MSNIIKENRHGKVKSASETLTYEEFVLKEQKKVNFNQTKKSSFIDYPAKYEKYLKTQSRFLERLENASNRQDSFTLNRVDSRGQESYNGKYTYDKLFVCGDVIEHYKYENPVFYDYTSETNGSGGRGTEKDIYVAGELVDSIRAKEDLYFADEKEYKEFLELRLKVQDDNYSKTLHRRKTRVRRLANTNAKILNKFLTLTFRREDSAIANISDVKEANKYFENFIKRVNSFLRKKGKPKLEYLAVIEFQDKNGDGAVHYHILCNLAYIKKKEIDDLWGAGYTWINSLSKQKRVDRVDNIGAYLVKYMKKDLGDSRLRECRGYLKSQGLAEPQEILDNRIVPKVFEEKGLDSSKVAFSFEYDTEYQGRTRYTQYNTSKLFTENKQFQLELLP